MSMPNNTAVTIFHGVSISRWKLFVPGLLIFISCFGVNTLKAAPPEKPNIVFILADDLGYGDLNCFGATKVTTPNIDRIAERGIRFTNAYSPHSVCTPSRYGLLTGQYAWRTWNGHETVWANDPLLIDIKRTTLPKIFKSFGYKTAIIGKWHLGYGAPGTPGWDDLRGPDYNRDLKPGPLEVGFDYYYGIPHAGQEPHMYIENHRVLNLTDSMRIILDKRFLNRPSYLERKGQPPAHTFEGYESAKYKQEDVAVNLAAKAVDWINKQGKAPFFLLFTPRNIHTPLAPNERFANTSKIGVYGDFINELDWSVGEIIKALEKKGIRDNTILVFASDNGGVTNYMPSEKIEVEGHYPNGPFFGQKTEVYEGGVHIPLIVSWPHHFAQGKVSEKLVALTDWTATFAALFKYPLKWNEGEDSFSFLGELTNTKPSGSQRQSVVVDSRAGLLGIREGDWKFISGKGGGSGKWWKPLQNNQMVPHQWNYPENKKDPPGQLYNLKDDPGETTNLYYERYDIVVKLRAELTRIMYTGRSR